jgi:hypothetical protein
VNYPRWEIHLDIENFDAFCKLMDDNGFGGFTASKASNGAWWIICYPSQDIKLMAKLRFRIVEVVDKFGIDAAFTDYPTP